MSNDDDETSAEKAPSKGDENEDRGLWPWFRTVLDGLPDIPCLNLLLLSFLVLGLSCRPLLRSGKSRAPASGDDEHH